MIAELSATKEQKVSGREMTKVRLEILVKTYNQCSDNPVTLTLRPPMLKLKFVRIVYCFHLLDSSFLTRAKDHTSSDSHPSKLIPKRRLPKTFNRSAQAQAVTQHSSEYCRTFCERELPYHHTAQEGAMAMPSNSIGS
jgi:hypothetical protein